MRRLGRACCRRTSRAEGAPAGQLVFLGWHDLLTVKKSIAIRDSIEAGRLRAAGAILMGSTVAGLTANEFGDSDRQPLNPSDTGRATGDSSNAGGMRQPPQPSAIVAR